MASINGKPNPAPPTWNLSESIESINEALRNLFGFDANDRNPIWRVVWSTDQYEKRMTQNLDSGIQLLEPEVRLLPKYQWCRDRWVLERYVIVPEFQRHELGDVKLSYEPIWVFETQAGAYLPPRIDVAKIVIDSIYAAQGKTSLKKYVDPEAADPLEARKARIDGIVAELSANETDVGDALAHGSGVTVPHNYDRPLITEK